MNKYETLQLRLENRHAQLYNKYCQLTNEEAKRIIAFQTEEIENTLDMMKEIDKEHDYKPYKRIKPNTRLIHARESKNLSKADLSRIMDVNFATITRWEKGEATPKKEHMKKLERVLGI